ncbi:major facilitator superfamily MFS_1 [Rippkaea orientalis PCC 8801]|uniref:Major facilitator superfamily MFS_1 n=1 Tax=Rippkaea orientalis (strain PCC 8801 / RF-1) TaxID=41431 RepID=B7JWF8_RIPO1|nr:MFS transporter [Rippkaea orientalis]ACK67003.1 major facilitator superfamily MFS_1 [Rippkaea orientalis PCC 8801]
MLTFLIIWTGQLASLIGSEMTNFAVTIWAWEITEQATPLSLILFFSQIPRLIASLLGGSVIDRCNRKVLLMLGDGVAGLSTIAILILFLTDHLAIWHLYLTGAINGFFSHFQTLTLSASLSLIVPKKHYTRVSAMNGVQEGVAYIIAPMSAGLLYSQIGLSGVLGLDLVTFIVAIASIFFVHIPQPQPKPDNQGIKKQFYQDITFGFHYLHERPTLLIILGFFIVYLLILNSNTAILSPMILARSGGDETVLGVIQMAFGVGGLFGATVISIWGGTKRQIHEFLGGMALQLGFLMLLGLIKYPLLWIAIAWFGGFFSLFPSSAYQAIWLSKVDPAVQGRVFATRSLIIQIALPFAIATSGPLADHIFAPAMKQGAPLANLLGGIFGTGIGAGMALQCSLLSAIGVLISLFAYRVHRLQHLDTYLPDYDLKSLGS